MLASIRRRWPVPRSRAISCWRLSIFIRGKRWRYLLSLPASRRSRDLLSEKLYSVCRASSVSLSSSARWPFMALYLHWGKGWLRGRRAPTGSVLAGSPKQGGALGANGSRPGNSPLKPPLRPAQPKPQAAGVQPPGHTGAGGFWFRAPRHRSELDPKAKFHTLLGTASVCNLNLIFGSNSKS